MDATSTWVPPATLDDVPGWLYPRDQAVLTWLLDRQHRLGEPGDLVELGCYQGKSAILIGTHLRPSERFTVCDLFGEEPGEEANRSEHNWSYQNLTRAAFERNYLAFHDELPTIVQAATETITEHVPPGSCRLVHVDASHLWEHVARDIESARTLLRPNGVVVVDDFRAEHTPGVAAAVWTAVATAGLRPICVTGNKFYGTWGDPGPVQDDLLAWLAGCTRRFHSQNVLGHRLVRIATWSDPPVPDLRSRIAPAATPPEPVPDPPAEPDRQPARWPSPRAIGRDLTPPLLTRALKRGLRQLRTQQRSGG